IQQLLDNGADPFVLMDRGQAGSILEAALSRNNSILGDLLLTNHPSPARRTPGGDTALHVAARWGRTNAMDFLLSSGFSINQTNNDGLTPLQSVAGSFPDAGSATRRTQTSIRMRGWAFPPSAPPSSVVGL